MIRYTLVQWDDHDDEHTECVVYVLAPDGEQQSHAEGNVTDIMTGRSASYQVIGRMLDALEGEAE